MIRKLSKPVKQKPSVAGALKYIYIYLYEVINRICLCLCYSLQVASSNNRKKWHICQSPVLNHCEQIIVCMWN